MHEDLRQLAHTYVTAKNYSRYDVNGYRFRTAKLEKSRPLAATVNSGVMTSGYDDSDKLVNYYGVLQNIVEIVFSGPKELNVVFFECDWFDPRNGIRVDKYGVVEVKHSSRLPSHVNSVVLANQAEQVYYLPYPHPSLRAWWVAFTVNPQVCPPKDVDMNTNIENDVSDVFQEKGREDNHGINEDIGHRFHVSDGEGLENLGTESRELIEETISKRKRSVPVRKSIRIQRIQERLNRQRVNEASSDADDF